MEAIGMCGSAKGEAVKIAMAESLFELGIRTRDVAAEIRVPPSVVSGWRLHWWNRRTVQRRKENRGGRQRFRLDDQNDCGSYCPSEDEIRERCEAIRQTWSASRLADNEAEPAVEITRVRRSIFNIGGVEF